MYGRKQTRFPWILMSFFFFFFAPTVPFILGRLGIPIFGNEATSSWPWQSGPNNLYFPCFFLRQKMIYLLVDRASLAQSQSRWSKRGLSPRRSLPHRLCLSDSHAFSTCLRFFLLFHLIDLYFLIFFTSSFTSALPFSLLVLSSWFWNDHPLFKLFSRACTNPSLSTSFHIFQKSSEENLGQHPHYVLFFLQWRSCRPCFSLKTHCLEIMTQSPVITSRLVLISHNSTTCSKSKRCKHHRVPPCRFKVTFHHICFSFKVFAASKQLSVEQIICFLFAPVHPMYVNGHMIYLLRCVSMDRDYYWSGRWALWIYIHDMTKSS